MSQIANHPFTSSRVPARVRAGLLAALVGLTCAAGCGDDESYVLVHGAWMGAWAWDRTADDLRADGADVTVVELPGHGDDQTPLGELSLAGYVAAVTDALDAQERTAVLVGHSMAGIVISQAAEERPDAIAQLVYVAAYLPRDGQSLLDLASVDADADTGAHLVFHDDGTVGLSAEGLVPVLCTDCPADAQADLEAGYRPEPGAPLAEPVSLTDARYGSVPRVYIETAGDRALSPALQQQMLADTPVDARITLDTAHTPQLSAPTALADALRDL